MSTTTQSPFFVDVEEGKTYSWCTCGFSAQQPFCDGAHKTQSDLKSLKWTAPETKKVVLCGCKKTKKPPFCDGSHAS
jgi:CDGSH-type Zn-finger protein